MTQPRVLTDRARALLKSPMGLQLLHLLEWRSEAGLSEAQLLDRAYEAASTKSVYRTQYDQHQQALKASADRYLSRAERIAVQMASWWSPLDRTNQIWAHPDTGAPDPLKLDLDLKQMHAEAPKPRSAFWTSTLSPDMVTPWVHWGENVRRAEPHRMWRIAIGADARVAEIQSPEDWRELCLKYPAKELGFRWNPSQERSAAYARVDPDWSSVANEWDGVHLTLGGLLTAEDVPVAGDGIVTELRGWNVESTVWLRWVFNAVQELDVHGRVSESGPGRAD